MSLAEQVGQMISLGLTKDVLDPATRAAIIDLHIGSVWLTTKDAAGVDGVREIAEAVDALAPDATSGGVGMFVAANQEGGLIQSLSGPGFGTIPSAVQQGTLSPATLQADARRWGGELLDAGITLDFAPVADVVPPGTDAQNAPIGQLHREYGHDPTTVASHVVAFIAGLSAAGVATTAKHFPGLGRVVGNTDDTANVVDTVTTIHDADLGPFSRAIRAGVPFVMVSSATYERIDPDHLAVFSPTIVGQLLRDDLGFRGVITSDSLDSAAVVDIAPAQRALAFVRAGGDLLVIDHLETATAMASALITKASTETTTRREITSAARVILAAKARFGLIDCS